MKHTVMFIFLFLFELCFTDIWPLNMQLLEEGEVVEDHSGQAQFTNALTDQVRNAKSVTIYTGQRSKCESWANTGPV